MILLIYVARAAPHKGLADLLSALERHIDKEWRLSVVGGISDADKGAVTRAIKLFSSRLSILGAQPLHNVASIMRESDVLVVPSRYENFCNTALEGLACGLPVVGPKCGGIQDMVEDRVNGLLYRVRDVDDLSRAIGWVLDNPGSIRDMSREAEATGRKYAWSRIAEMTEEALSAALS